MNVFQTIPIALRALVRNPLRSFLTMLGVVIGIASVVSMVSIGEGAKAAVEKVFNTMGTNMLVVVSGSTSSGGMMGGYGSMPTLTWEDLAAIRSEVPSVRWAAPAQNAKVTLVSDDANWTTTVTGTTPELFDIRAWKIQEGTLFGDEEVEAGSKVIVIGQTTADKLFGSGVNPVGRVLRLRGAPFTVIGILERKGQNPMGMDYDDAAFVPVTSFQARVQGGLQKYIGGVIMVSATSAEDTKRAQQQITALLRERHGITGPAEDDFSIRNLTELANAQQQGTKSLTALLAAIAVVSLVVGGIGIMNIMLVSVRERTREIGVRMAVGAKPWNVLAQFLVEAMTLSTIGGVVGILVGGFAARALAGSVGWSFTVRPDIAILSFGVSAAVGIGFGIYPARRAALLDPIEALRAE